MMSCDVCDGLEFVRRTYNGRGIMNSAVRARFGRVAVPMRLFVTETVTVAQVSLLYRSPNFVLLDSIAGVAIDITNRTGGVNKRPYHSLVTFSLLWGEPNVMSYPKFDGKTSECDSSGTQRHCPRPSHLCCHPSTSRSITHSLNRRTGTLAQGACSH